MKRTKKNDIELLTPPRLEKELLKPAGRTSKGQKAVIKAKEAMAERDQTVSKQAMLKLPADLNESVFRSALELDQVYGKGRHSEEVVQTKVMSHGKKLLDSLSARDLFTGISIGWPASLYIPGNADWKKYWIMAPPGDHRYALSWTPAPSPAGYNTASHATGNIYCSQRIRTIDKYVQSEAGLGILYTPQHTLSVVSMQPVVNCSGDHRWFSEFGTPGFSQVRTAGSTQIKISLMLAAWQKIPGPAGWDLLHWKQFEVAGNGPSSGSGQGAIAHYDRFFTGKDLATPFLVESARTYLFGVVARVSAWSSLTDDRGRPLPLIEDGTFRVWGSVACMIPQIEIVVQQVHIP
jgi:hypothetical protein